MGNNLLKKSLEKKYFNLYDKFIKKELEKKSLLHCFYGHTHISRSGDFFTNIGSYKDGYFAKTESGLVLSDVHLGLFPYSKKELSELKRIISAEEKIILLGDFFDLFYDRPSDIALRFADIIKIIRQKIKRDSLVYIRGNHDWHAKKHLDLETVDWYSEKNNLFIHGHKQDPLMSVFPLKMFYSARMSLGYKWPVHTKKIYSRYLSSQKINS